MVFYNIAFLLKIGIFNDPIITEIEHGHVLSFVFLERVFAKEQLNKKLEKWYFSNIIGVDPLREILNNGLL